VGAPAAGDVVLVPFPFSDLSQSKVRPFVSPTRSWGLDSLSGHQLPIRRPCGGPTRRTRFRIRRVARRQLRPAGQAVHRPCGVDGPLGRRTDPDCVRASAVRGCSAPPTSGESLTRNEARHLGMVGSLFVRGDVKCCRGFKCVGQAVQVSLACNAACGLARRKRKRCSAAEADTGNVLDRRMD
jgi:hypothetical protein